MAETTGIKWCDATFNPWIGCQRVSPGCEHCYAETQANFHTHWTLGADGARRRKEGARLPVWGPQAPRRVTSDSNWKQPMRWNRIAEKAGVRRRVFCASLADVFEDRRELDGPRARLWSLMEATPSLDWLTLTKRPQHVRTMVPAGWLSNPWPRNVWIGTTCEDQRRAEERLPHLLQIPAAVRFVSAEPLLEAVDFRPWLPRLCDHCRERPAACLGVYEEPANDLQYACNTCCGHGNEDGHCDPIPGGIDWLIVGGESGPGARPFDVAWARETVRACKAAAVPCFVKQFGAAPFDSNINLSDYAFGTAFRDIPDGLHRGGAAAGLLLRDPKGGDINEFPEDLRVREFPNAT